ncbi:hypothetical protein KY385_01750 [Candidatus Parcubacteria bacterium]|nr:hypothetical protein [Candidatus Parcubacteria bacterium]
MKRKLGEQGALNILLIPLIISSVCFFGVLGFAAWAFYERNDYKNNVDQKIEAAVEVANEKLATEKDNEFLEREKFPLSEYQGPAQFGGIKVSYPKTWSSYILNEENAEYIFNPKFVSAANDSPHALKITVEGMSYDESITKYEGQVRDGLLKAVAYSLPKVPGVVGVKFDGQVEEGRVESVIVLPLRDKTITIASQASDRFKDFNNIILPDLTFSP